VFVCACVRVRMHVGVRETEQGTSFKNND
jgi:hypothetical protein